VLVIRRMPEFAVLYQKNRELIVAKRDCFER